MKYIILLFVVVLLGAYSLFVGYTDISMSDVFNMSDNQSLIMVASRIPRLAAVIIAGASMSVCGVIMQQMTHNRFVSPTTAGTMDAAALGIMLSMLLFPDGGTYQRLIVSLGVTLAASALFMSLAERIKFKNLVFVPLLGIIFGNILDSVTTFIGLQFNVVHSMASWLHGDFSSVMQGRYEIMYISVPLLAAAYVYADRFTLMGMGKSFSVNLGMNYSTVFRLGLVIVSCVTSVIVLTVGMIPFVGLIVPNVISMLYGDNLRKTLPLTALSGSAFLLACDILGRTIMAPYEISISVMVGIIGGAVFLYLILGRRLNAG
jgi:iron complex transport system permease protein